MRKFDFKSFVKTLFFNVVVTIICFGSVVGVELYLKEKGVIGVCGLTCVVVVLLVLDFKKYFKHEGYDE